MEWFNISLRSLRLQQGIDSHASRNMPRHNHCVGFNSGISLANCQFIRPVSPVCTPSASSHPSLFHCKAHRPLKAVLQKEMTNIDIKRLEPGKRFNQIVIHNGMVYLSGQVSRVPDRSVYQQTVNTLLKIDGLLEKAGTNKSRVISVTIWMSDIREFAEMNRAWDEWLDKDHMPVRATVQAALAAPELSVEIQVTAALPSPAKVITTEGAAGAVGPYNQGVVVDDGTIYVSGCIGLLPGGGGMAGASVEAQTEQALQNMRAILKDAGAGPGDIVKTTILLDNMSDFGKVNDIYKGFFCNGRVPARSCFAAKQLPKDALVEIEAIASLPRI